MQNHPTPETTQGSSSGDMEEKVFYFVNISSIFHRLIAPKWLMSNIVMSCEFFVSLIA